MRRIISLLLIAVGTFCMQAHFCMEAHAQPDSLAPARTIADTARFSLARSLRILAGIGGGLGHGLGGVAGFAGFVIPAPAGIFSATVFGMADLDEFWNGPQRTVAEYRLAYGWPYAGKKYSGALSLGPAYVQGSSAPESAAHTKHLTTWGLGFAAQVCDPAAPSVGLVLSGNVNLKAPYAALMFYFTL